MRGSKVGLADLKRLKKDLQAERERAALAQRVAVLKKADTAPVDDMAAFKRTMQSVTPIKQAARVEHKPVPPPAPARRRATALG